MEKEIIIYIHGFRSTGYGGKATLFRKSFGKKVITPSLSYVPALAIDTLDQLIQSYKELGIKVSLIGSSLGGFYSIYLANKFDIKAVLINPAMAPFDLLDKLGLTHNFYDFTKFECTQKHLDYLKTIKVENKDDSKYLLLLCKDDDVLDYNEAIKELPKAKKIVQENGGHQFEGVEKYFEEINNFLENY